MAKTKTKKFAAVKRMLSPKDARLGGAGSSSAKAAAKAAAAAAAVRNVPQVPSALFFKYNTALGPPYHLLIDTNFVNFAVKNKLEIVRAAMDCLLAKVVPCITDCVMAELEKLGAKYRVALRIAKDPRFERICCGHRGTYADDCLVNRVTEHRCYIVATCDKDLKRRLRKIPGVPIMYIKEHKFAVERLPEANSK
jgi:U3 small nucleolar RNA-associated protein 24